MQKHKKQWQKGFASIELIIAAVVIVAMVSVGFYSFNRLKAVGDTIHPSISGISPKPAQLGQKVTIKKGTTAFKTGQYRIYYHGTNDATHKILITDTQNSDSTGATLTFTMPTNNLALNAVLKTSGTTTGGMQVKDSSGLYSNSYAFTIGALPLSPVVVTPKPSPTATMPEATPSNPNSSTTPESSSDEAISSDSFDTVTEPATTDSSLATESSESTLAPTTLSATPSPQANTNKIFMLGGSIFARLLAGSDIKQRLKSNGWNLNYDAVGGRTLGEGLEVAKSKPGIVKNANVIIVALGINNHNNTDSEFITKLDALYQYLRSQNSSAKIYWLNYAIYYMGPKGDAKEQARVDSVRHKNTVLETYAKANNIKIIDWVKESSRADYGNPNGDDVHPSTDGRAHLSKFINQKIGLPTKATTSKLTVPTSKSLVCKLTFSLLGCPNIEPVGTPNPPQIVNLTPSQGPAGAKVKVWGNSTFAGKYKINIIANNKTYKAVTTVGTTNSGESITFTWPKSISDKGTYRVTVTDSLGRTSNSAKHKIVKCRLANRWLCN